MGFCDKDYAALQARAKSDDREKLHREADRLPPGDLVAIWREMQTTPFLKKSEGCRFFEQYFNFVAYAEETGAARARKIRRWLEFLVAGAELERDDEIFALCAVNGPFVAMRAEYLRPLADMIESSAQRARLCWLLGALRRQIAHMHGLPEDFRRRLLALSDAEGFEAWRARHTSNYPADISTAPVSDLAKAYIENCYRSPVEVARDGLRRALTQRLRELRENDAPLLLRLILEVERRDRRDELRYFLAADILEDLICDGDPAIIAAIEREARKNDGLKDLLGGVWLSRASPEVAARIETAREGKRW